jgi:SPW repeat
MTMRRWVDWVNIILAAWLAASPWLLVGAAGDGPAAWSSWSAGTGLVMLALLAMYRPAVWSDAMGIMLGAWLIASPWVLGFASATVALANAVIMGSLVIAYAFWAVGIDITSRQGAEHDTHRI